MDKRFVIDTSENDDYLYSLTIELLNFGKNFLSPEGASYYLDLKGQAMPERPLETWITCRMAHCYVLGEILGFAGSRELVNKAIKGIKDYLHDPVYNGYFPYRNDKDNFGLEKQCYSHAFVLLACASAMLIDDPLSKDLYKNIKAVFLDKFYQEEYGLAVDTWDREFNNLDKYRGLNANMHTVEAFLALYDVTSDNIWHIQAGRIIKYVLNWASQYNWRIPEHFDENWQAILDFNDTKKDDPFKPYGVTPGHAIEWARLISQWTLSSDLDDNLKQENIAKAELLYLTAYKDAWNIDGNRGIVYTTDYDGKPIIHDRMHWTLAEAINTSSVLYHITAKKIYAEHYYEYLQYLEDCVHDRKYGSWFHQLDQNNHLKETVWPGKCDLYHALQATLIPRLDPSKSIAVALKDNLYIKR